MKSSHSTLFFISCIILGLSLNACDCSNPKGQYNTPPSLPSKHNTPPPPPQKEEPYFLQKLNDARLKLDKEANKSNPAPELKAIHNVLKTYAPQHGPVTINKSGNNEVIARFNVPKNGREMFDNLLAATKYDSSTDKAINWAIEQDIIDINESNSQGITPLEATITDWINARNDLDAQRLETFTKVLVDKAAPLAPDKAAQLLEKLIQRNTTSPHPQANQVFDLLEKQGAQLPPQKASELLEKLTEKLLHGPQAALAPSGLAMKMVKFLQDRGGKILPAIEPSKSKATTLLQQAVEKKQGHDVYKLLLDLGADPNSIQVEDGYPSKKIPLLNYANKHYDRDLLDELVQNKHTDINVVEPAHKFTVAMQTAYEGGHNWPGTEVPQYPFETMNKLLQREDLDINKIHGNKAGAPDYTLLDIIIQDCMMRATGHTSQVEKIKKCNAEWLKILTTVKERYQFEVTEDNIHKAQARYIGLINAMDEPVIQSAEQAFKIIGVPLPDEKRMQEIWKERMNQAMMKETKEPEKKEIREQYEEHWKILKKNLELIRK